MQNFDFTKLPSPEEVQKRVQDYTSAVVTAQVTFATSVYAAWTSLFKPVK